MWLFPLVALQIFGTGGLNQFFEGHSPLLYGKWNDGKTGETYHGASGLRKNKFEELLSCLLENVHSLAMTDNQ